MRNIVENRVKANLLGPGSEPWHGYDPNDQPLHETEEQELITQKPAMRYLTGILFPQIQAPKIANRGEVFEDDGATSDQLEIDFSEEDEHNDITVEVEAQELEKRKKVGDEEISLALPSMYMPSSMGISFAVSSDEKELNLEVTYAKYHWVEWSKRVMPLSETESEQLFDNALFGLRPKFVQEHLRYENDTLYFNQQETENGNAKTPYNYASSHQEEPVNIPQGNDIPRIQLTNWKNDLLKKSDVDKTVIYQVIDKLYRLVGRDVYKREPQRFNARIVLAEGSKSVKIKEDTIEIRWDIKPHSADKDLKLVRISLVNRAKVVTERSTLSIGDPEVSLKALFQTGIRVETSGETTVQPYKANSISTQQDDEKLELDLQYKDLKAFAVGHNVSATWIKDHRTKDPKCVFTTWLPTTPVVPITTQLPEEHFDDRCLDLKNLMTGGTLPDNEVIDVLRSFIKGYDVWVQQQLQQAQNFTGTEREAATRITDRQGESLARLQAGLDHLNYPEVMRCFRLAMFAMRIQMILSRDVRFGCNVKSDINHVDWPNVNLEFFGSKYDNPALGTKLRPFQLAFILLSIEGIVKPESSDRSKIVDLIWFPTGGGKTEAYLGLTAFTIIWRRRTGQQDSFGTTVIMRYTLRLLTAQQFERASRLICALEYMRLRGYENELGKSPITIGLFVGSSSTPNTIAKANEISKEIKGKGSSENKFQVHSCPWCGFETDQKGEPAFQVRQNRLFVECKNDACDFSSIKNQLPLLLVDEQIYDERPTLLFGTVDKFAQIIHKPEAHRLFGKGTNKCLPPDLIIQDEFHLISGPIGSAVGLFETVIEDLCTNNNIAPKIVASTATTRNTSALVKQVFGKHRQAAVFPAAGLNEEDSYFARKDPSKQDVRRYIGIIPTGRPAAAVQTNLMAQFVIARIDILKSRLPENFKNSDNKQEALRDLDKFWTILSYYNSLREVGIAETKISSDVKDLIKDLYNRLPREAKTDHNNQDLFFKQLWLGFAERKKELTSRIPSPKVKSTMASLQEPLASKDTSWGEVNYYAKNVVDIGLATNMISVGLDVSRLNLMIINGMPRSVAEYIQASSRVARQDQGLVYLICSPFKARERSTYEHFQDFHQAMYKQVEPLSATPSTEATLELLLPSLLVALARNSNENLIGKDAAGPYEERYGIELLEKLNNRFDLSESILEFCRSEISRIKSNWEKAYRDNSNVQLKVGNLLMTPSRTLDDELQIASNLGLKVVQSLRTVTPSATIKFRFLPNRQDQQSDNN